MQQHDNTTAPIHCCLIPSAFPKRVSSWQGWLHRILISCTLNKQQLTHWAKRSVLVFFASLFWCSHTSHRHIKWLSPWHHQWKRPKTLIGQKFFALLSYWIMWQPSKWIYPWRHLVSLLFLFLHVIVHEVFGHWSSCKEYSGDKQRTLFNIQARPLWGTQCSTHFSPWQSFTATV